MAQQLLTIRVGGTHFSFCLFDINTGAAANQHPVSVPVAYLSRRQTIEMSWKNALQYLDVDASDLVACAIAAPLRLLSEGEKHAANTRYQSIADLNLKNYFADLFKLDPSKLMLTDFAEAFLEGQLLLSPDLAEPGICGLYIGGDFSAARYNGDEITNLNWENAEQNGSSASQRLSVLSVLSNYYQRAGISVMNIREFSTLCAESLTARETLDDYLKELNLFLAEKIESDKINGIILGGDLANSCPFIFTKLLRSVKSVPIYRATGGTEAIHKGIAKTFFNNSILEAF